jgi:hypothetical protein
MDQQANAQSFERKVIGSARAYATSTSGSMEWTIGEVVTETYLHSGISLTQGFHQPQLLKVLLKSDWEFFFLKGFHQISMV